MKTYQIIISSLIIIFFSSCFHKGRKDYYNEEKIRVLNEIQNRVNITIPDSLFDFFPQKSDSVYMTLTTIKSANVYLGDSLTIKRFAPSAYEVTYLCQDTAILDFTVKKIQMLAIEKCKSESDDYFIIGYQEKLFSKFDSIGLTNKFKKYENKILIADLASDGYFFKDSLTLSGLASDYEIILLKSDNSFVLPATYKYEWSILPESIRHGYRAGIAFNKNDLTIIYWVVAW